jgi:superfamily II DNA or RNA helicase
MSAVKLKAKKKLKIIEPREEIAEKKSAPSKISQEKKGKKSGTCKILQEKKSAPSKISQEKDEDQPGSQEDTNSELISKDILDKMFPYQISHLKNMLSAIMFNDIAFDASDTGTGKTYTTVPLCKYLDYNLVVICPLSVLFNWKRVCLYYGVKPLMIVNYETIRNGKMYCNTNFKSRKHCPYITKVGKTFTWKLPEKTLIVFDEAHMCSSSSSLCGKLLLSLKDVVSEESKIRMLLLSATLADNNQKFKIFGYMLGLYETIRHANKWLRANGDIIGIHKAIFPQRGSRMKIAEMKDQFKDNNVRAQLFDSDEKAAQKIDECYQLIEEARERLRAKEEKDNSALTEILRARQKIELIKLPIVIELIKEYLETTHISVVVFINFRDTLETLAKFFKTDCIVQGGQKAAVREANIQAFQENKKRLILCNKRSGGVGVRFHDTIGDHPRVCIHFPCFSAITFKQCIGRALGVGMKSAARLNEKLRFIEKLNDGDLYHKEVEGLDVISKATPEEAEEPGCK